MVDLLLTALVSAEVVTVNKPWGVEHIVKLDDCLVKVITVNEGHQTSLQYHNVKKETIVPLMGSGMVMVKQPGHVAFHQAGSPVYIKPGTVHRAIGPITMLEVTTLENDDVVRVEDPYGR